MMKKTKVKNNDWKKVMKYVLLLLIFCVFVINYFNLTGAKYRTESDTVTDSARVAKWISGTTISLDLFKSSYLADDPAISGNSVESANGIDKVVAPGTSASYEFRPSITGSAPEVAYKLQFNATGEYIGDWKVDNVAYEPLKFSLTKKEGANETNIVSNTTLENLITKLNEVGNGTIYAPNQAPDTASYIIAWEWPFFDTVDTDVKDTALGTKVLNENLTVKLTSQMSVVQVD